MSTPATVETEVRDYLDSKIARRRLFPRAALVGIASGVVSVAFRIALQVTEQLRTTVANLLPHNDFLRAAVLGLIAFAGTRIAMAIGKLDPDAGGSGIPHMKAVLEGHATMNWARIIWVKFLSASIGIGSGLAMGREGPTVQMSGAIGQGVSALTGAQPREQRALIAAGAGAGLAGAFNAPLAGVTFVLEELQRDFQPVVFGAALLAAALSTVVSRMASGQFPVFTVPSIDAPRLTFFPLFIVIGVVGGLLGVLFNKFMLKELDVLSSLRQRHPWWMATMLGVLVWMVAWLSPALLGGGHKLSESALGGEIFLGPAIAFLIARFLLIQSSYATGAPGGIFSPLLSLGALAGVAVYRLLQFVDPHPGISIAACVVCGMCAMFSGVVRAPLTGIILIGEMTGSYDLLLPLLAVAFTAYAVADGLHDTPIYEALLQRDALKKSWNLHDDEPITLEFEIQQGSEFAGKAIKDLGLPRGVIVITYRSGGLESVPNAETILEAHGRIMVASNSGESLRIVERGVRGHSSS